MPQHIAIFGAGIAGLSAAHALNRQGHRVTVFESTSCAGGFFRSVRRPDLGGLPSEYSWHGMGPWYHNFYDLMKQIPGDDGRSLYDSALSRPIDFGLFPDDGPARFFERDCRSLRRMFRLGWWEFAAGMGLMLRTWCAQRRSETDYARRNAAEAWERWLGPRGLRTWRASFGPWIGSDWTQVSLHQAGRFFLRQLTSHPAHPHAADEEGPAWMHGAADGWLLLRGPSSEVWFEPWTRDLARRGVDLRFNQPLHRLLYRAGRIQGAELASGGMIHADHYVLALNPFAATEILARTPDLERCGQLSLFRPLVQGGPHVQVSFRLGFSEPIRFRRPRTAVVVADSEFNLTLFATEQAWAPHVSPGEGIRALWTGTACAAQVPGRLFGLPLSRCTRGQFLAEVIAQLRSCRALDEEIRAANGGRGFADFRPKVVEVWPEWVFSADGIGGPQPKWVNTTRTQPYQPTQATPVPNLTLAGAHTRTEADVWSIEAAVESGRRAAGVIDPAIGVQSQHRPRVLHWLGRIDDLLFACHGPHVLDVLAAVLLLAAGAAIWALTA